MIGNWACNCIDDTLVVAVDCLFNYLSLRLVVVVNWISDYILLGFDSSSQLDVLLCFAQFCYLWNEYSTCSWYSVYGGSQLDVWMHLVTALAIDWTLNLLPVPYLYYSVNYYHIYKPIMQQNPVMLAIADIIPASRWNRCHTMQNLELVSCTRQLLQMTRVAALLCLLGDKHYIRYHYHSPWQSMGR